MELLKADGLPWLAPAQRALREASAKDRLPHSLLISSVAGLGAPHLADWTSALVLCEANAIQRPCGICAACRLLAADTHPDHHRVGLEQDASQIKVEQVRELIEVLSFKSYRGGYKVGVIDGAENLNVNGANAFLKTLEEPSDRTMLIMVTRPAHRLPSTIASRCQRLVLRVPDEQTALQWLESSAPRAGSWQAALALAGGAPLSALELDAAQVAELEADMRESVRQLSTGGVDVSLVAEHWLRSNPGLRLAWLENWITRCVHGSLGGANSMESAERVRLPAALLKPKIRTLFELLDAARDLRRLSSTGMNQQLALEAFLLGFRSER